MNKRREKAAKKRAHLHRMSMAQEQREKKERDMYRTKCGKLERQHLPAPLIRRKTWAEIRMEDDATRDIRSACDDVIEYSTGIESPTPETLELIERERMARQVAEHRKTMTAPLYSKGPYQYVGDAPPEIIETLGRKV